MRLASEKQHNRHFLFNYLAICPIKCPSALPRISISFVVVLSITKNLNLNKRRRRPETWPKFSKLAAAGFRAAFSTFLDRDFWHSSARQNIRMLTGIFLFIKLATFLTEKIEQISENCWKTLHSEISQQSGIFLSFRELFRIFQNSMERKYLQQAVPTATNPRTPNFIQMKFPFDKGSDCLWMTKIADSRSIL